MSARIYAHCHDIASIAGTACSITMHCCADLATPQVAAPQAVRADAYLSTPPAGHMPAVKEALLALDMQHSALTQHVASTGTPAGIQVGTTSMHALPLPLMHALVLMQGHLRSFAQMRHLP